MDSKSFEEFIVFLVIIWVFPYFNVFFFHSVSTFLYNKLVALRRHTDGFLAKYDYLLNKVEGLLCVFIK